MAYRFLTGMTILASLWSTYGQSTTAVCNSAFTWMVNEKNQSPCLVAAYLQGACGSGNWTVPLLPLTADGQVQAYNAPNDSTANLCTCSGATYNLMSACAACQGGGWLLFAPWALYCEAAGLLSLPADFPPNIPVPSDTSIPQYAATDPRAWAGTTFDVTQARQIALGGPAPTLTSTSSSSTSAASTSSSPATSSLNPTPRPVKHDNTGTIVGGVVGGILGVSLIAVIILWLLCAQSIQRRFGKVEAPPREKRDILGRAFNSPAEPPTLANIVVPVPMRPYQARPDFQSYMSNTTAGSNTGDYPGSMPFKESGSPEELAASDVGMMERGGSQNHASVARQNTTSSLAGSLLRRVTSSVRWRRRRTNTTIASVGTGTLMTPTATGMDSDTGHGSNNVSRQNTARRMVEPVPFMLPQHPEESTIVDISSTNVDQLSHGPSAAEEKRRLNPPAYASSVPWSTNNARSQHSDPAASNSLLDLPSGAATAGSEIHSASFAPAAPSALTPGGFTSVPSNILMASPYDAHSQTASSGVLDPSPVRGRGIPAANLRFAVTNPSREVEM